MTVSYTISKKINTPRGKHKKYIIPQNRRDCKGIVRRAWHNRNDPKARTLIVTIDGVEHVYPPKAGVIILNRAMDRILIIKNRGFNGGPAKWGIPKGHLEKGEYPHECASRELYEETGIRITIDKKATNMINSINNTVYYIYTVNEKQVILAPVDTDEISDIKFCYINFLKSTQKTNLNKELQKVVGKYRKKILKLSSDMC